MKRNRIVIDFGKKSAGTSASGRARLKSGRGAGRILLVIALILLVLFGGALIGGYLWWRGYQRGPAYSLALLADAAQRNDTATIDTILDNDKVTDDFVSQVRQRTSGSYSSTIGSLLPGQTNSAGSTLSPKLKQTVHDQVVREIERMTESAAGKPFILVALVVPRFVEIKQENDVANALVNIKGERVRLTMQHVEERWRITAIQDDKLAQLIADGIRRSFSTQGSQLQDQIRKQIDKLQNKQ